MRNLKRALSLALASVMLLGMMVVGTSAASYPDVDENDNVEAIEVLNAVKVMIGDRGNFRPDAPVNRHEMATIMAKLVLGNETADNYVGTHPFTDVFPWADKYVAACYENGLVSGTSATTFSGNQPLTAVQAAAMMLRALGYKDLSKGATDWRAPVTAMANQIRLFSGVASNPSEQLNRNQVAQLTLNTLKSPVVDLKDNTFDVSSGDGAIVITGGSREYIVRSSSESYARAINRTEYQGTSASSVGGYTIELGEHLYNGKLRLEDTTDAFGRPARQWEYDGKAIGAYAKEELLRREYTAKVTGRDLYDLLGKTTIDEYDFIITVDGETEADTLKEGDNSYFTEGNLVRTNTNAIGATDKGVLTQVFVDSGEKDVYISIINTYLAKASKDYDTKKEEATFTVYGVEDIESGSAITLVKNTANKSASTPYTEPLKVRNEDINVENVKEDDFFLVNVAEGEIKVMTEPEVKSDATITSFKKGSWVNSDGQIDYADTAKYDPEVLDEYNQKNMKDLTYNIFMDKYGYLIGLEQNEDPDQYVFITGRQAGDNDLGHANADMRAIFLDGTVKVITVNTKDGANPTGGAFVNTWFKYSVDKNDIYTLEAIPTTMTSSDKVAQSAQNAKDIGGAGNKEFIIDKNHISLDGSGTFSKVYGNDDTVYLGVSLNIIGNATELEAQATDTGITQTVSGAAVKYFTDGGATKNAAIIDEVDSVTVGVKNTSLVAKDVTKTQLGSSLTKLAMPLSEVYTLYKDNGYVIAAVVIGEDEGSNANYAYITGSSYNSEGYDKTNDEWTWTKEAVVDGKIVDLTEKGSTIKYLDKMEQGCWYEVRYDADGNVRGIKAHGGSNNGDVAFTSGTTDQYINTVANYETATDAHDTVLMQVQYVAAAKQLTYKNGSLYTNTAATEGFSVSPSVKTVVSLSKVKAGAGVAPFTGVAAFDDITDGYDGYSGLEDAIADLDDNFKGYLNVVFKDGVATVIILDDRTGSKVDEGSDPTPPTGKYSSVVDTKITTGLDKLALDDSNNNSVSAGALSLNVYGGGSVAVQIREALVALGYTIDGNIVRDNANSKYTVKTTKDGVEETIEIADSGISKYWIVDVDGAKQYVLNGTGTVDLSKGSSDAGTGFIKSVDGGKTFVYGAAYNASISGFTADTQVKKGYVKVTADSLSTITGVTGSTVTYTASGETVAAGGATGYAKVGSKIVITVDFKTGALTAGKANATLAATGYTAAISKAATLGNSAAAETVATDTVTFPTQTGTYTGGVYTFTKTVADSDMSGDITIPAAALTNA